MILQDSVSVFWQVTVDGLGRLVTTLVGAGPADVVKLSASGFSWQVGITTGGLLTTTAISFDASYPTIAALDGIWILDVTAGGLLETSLSIGATSRSLSIWRTGGSDYIDYSAWVQAVSGAPLLRRTHALNQPRQLEFTLTDGVAGFAVPEAGNRVRVQTVSLPEFFTGYITNTPERALSGQDSFGNPVYGYKCTASDESQALEWPAAGIFPTLQPFTNKTQGEIIKELIALLGSSMDVTNVDDGILLPEIRAKQDEGFWDLVRRISDRTNMKFWTSAGKAYYKAYDDSPFGFDANEADRYFNPDNLTVTPSANPIFNDVVGIGGVEPTTYVHEHFAGDGFTPSWTLRLPLYGTQSSKLLEDDFTQQQSEPDATNWLQTDPNGIIDLHAGSLRFLSAPTGTPSRLTAKQGIEIAGVLPLRAGRFRFNIPSSCLLGGIFGADDGTLASCKAGFLASSVAGATVLQPVIAGVAVGPTYVTVLGNTYEFILTVSCSQQVRHQREFFSALNSFGGDDVPASAVISFQVTELTDLLQDNPVVKLSYAATIDDIEEFLFFTEVAGPIDPTVGIDLVANFCLLRKSIIAQLQTKKPTDATFIQRPLGDKADSNVWAAIVPGSDNQAQLEFFTANVPVRGELIHFFYREAGVARARVQLPSSIAAEALKSGDRGVRSGILPNISPVPRNTAELETAIQAYIDDHTAQFFDGSWVFDSRVYTTGDPYTPGTGAFQANAFQNSAFQYAAGASEGWGTLGRDPIPGRFISINAPSRHPAFVALVLSVQVDLLFLDETGLEFFQTTATFGRLARYDEARPLDPAVDAIVGQLDTVTAMLPTDFSDIGASFADDRPDADFDETITDTTIEIDTKIVPDSFYEVRKTNAGWGSPQTINQIAVPTTQTFTIPRRSRDLLAYIKNKNGGTLSRYPTAVRVFYPLVPTSPIAAIDISDPHNPVIEINPAILDNVDVTGFEIRADDDITVLDHVESIILQPTDLTFTVLNNSSSDLSFHIYTINLLGEYSPGFALTRTISPLEWLNGVQGLFNPSFELNAGGTPAGSDRAIGASVSDRWTVWSKEPGFSVFYDIGAMFANSGAAYLLIQCLPDTVIAAGSTIECRVASELFPVLAGNTLRIGGFRRWDQNVSVPAGLGILQRQGAFFYAADGITFISEAVNDLLNAPSSGAYVHSTDDVVVPAGAVFARFQFGGLINNSTGSPISMPSSGGGPNLCGDLRFDDAALTRV